MKLFLKEMNNLKNQSIMRKNDRQKRMIYLNKLKKEEEEKNYKIYLNPPLPIQRRKNATNIF